MNKKKLFAAVISLALVIAMVLPGTLAVSVDQASSDGTVEVSAENTLPEPGAEQTPVSEETEQPVEPELPEEVPVCTCDPQPAEGEAHQEDCPLYTAPAVPEAPAVFTHVEGCFDGCTDELCPCGCHLFDRIMACTTLDEIWALLNAASEEALNALTDEQNALIDAKIEELEPAPAPAIVIGESEPPVPSEVDYAMINYTNVAPLGDPITGQHQ